MITDCWLNPVSGVTTVLGYREDLEEFPHEIYSYFLSSIRELDVANVRLLWRWLRGIQTEFQAIYGKILNLPMLLSPDYCPEEYLDYLKDIVGITDNLHYLWGVLDTNEKRRLIRYFVRFLMYRATPMGITEILEAMTGKNIEIVNYFDMRWIISGDTTEMETALGREDLGYDPHLLSGYEMEMSRVPDEVSVVTVGGFQHYRFVITELILNLEGYNNTVDWLEPMANMPKYVRLIYRPASASVVVPISMDGNDFIAHAPADDFFGQSSTALSLNTNDFRVGFDCDLYVFDVKIDDPDNTLDHAVVEAIAKFFRPISERIYIRYYSYLEDFTVTDNWSLIEGTAVYDVEAKDIVLGGALFSRYRLIVDGSDDWESYSVTVKASILSEDKYFEIRFNKSSDTEYFYLRVTPGIPATYPAGSYRFGKVSFGMDIPLGMGDLEQLDTQVDYMWRIVVQDGRTNPDLGSRFTYELYQDEVCFKRDSIVSAGLPRYGTVELVSEAGTEVFVSKLEVHPFPMESTYIGI